MSVWDAERQGKFFIEFRVHQPAVVQAFSKIQEDCESAGGLVLQSCRADNMHVTMNGFSLKEQSELEAVRAALRSCNVVDQGGSVNLRTVGNFKKRVLYIGVEGPLKELFVQFDAALKGAGVSPVSRGVFTPHMTICKAKPPRKTLSDEVLNAVPTDLDLGSVPLRELFLCAKRKKDETTPLVVMRL